MSAAVTPTGGGGGGGASSPIARTPTGKGSKGSQRLLKVQSGSESMRHAAQKRLGGGGKGRGRNDYEHLGDDWEDSTFVAPSVYKARQYAIHHMHAEGVAHVCGRHKVKKIAERESLAALGE